MSYTSLFTTKEQVSEYSLLIEASAVPDHILRRADGMVEGELKRNGKVEESTIDYTDMRLVMACEYAALYLLQTYQIIPGFFGASGERSGTGSSNVNVSFGRSKGGSLPSRVPEIEQEKDAPDYYHAFQRYVLDYVQDRTTAAHRIDETEPRLSNAFQLGLDSQHIFEDQSPFIISGGTDKVPTHTHTEDTLILLHLNNQYYYTIESRLEADTDITLAREFLDNVMVFLDGKAVQKDSSSTSKDRDYWINVNKIRFTFAISPGSVILIFWAG